MSESLKPCPFCGNVEMRFSHLTGAIFCEECGCEGPWSPAFDGNWNSRVPVDLWNRDISRAPKGEMRKVKRGEREMEHHVPTRILAAGSGGVVTVSQWDPKREAWSMFTRDCPPIAWMPWPDHPGDGDYVEISHA